MFPRRLYNFCTQLLQKGSLKLNLPVGIVSHIYNNNYEIVAINSNVGSMRSGIVFPLSETYCRDVYDSGKTVATADVERLAGHPLYVKMPLKAYISAPIHFQKGIWGTVNFTSGTPHPPFTKADIQLVESYAKKVTEQLMELNTASIAYP